MTADCFCFIVRGNLWRIAGLRQLALLDLSILNFGLMRACRREDAPLRMPALKRKRRARHRRNHGLLRVACHGDEYDADVDAGREREKE
jgi:hypothetical protein